MDPAAAKQQIVERVRQATNVLVTVSTNPTVDQLAACIGLTLLLNKMQKHATAVFSGQVPSTLEFLQPERTIETNTDSLRDFIISLDKEKADKLRYKVEDQVVKIFITPYRTSLTEKDLMFGQGDFNVEVVMALGIKDRNQIDAAISAHGRILHDATVISLNAGQGKAPDVGQINWQDTSASSLSEMLVSISEAFGGGLIDGQIATAFLTGIVAETARFGNAKTSPKVMTMSAQLMAAGANQQLIVSKLDQAAPPQAAKPVAEKTEESEVDEDGTLSVKHDLEAKLKESERKQKEEKAKAAESDEIHIDEQGNLKTAGELIKPIESEKKEDDDDDSDKGPKSPLEAVTSTAEESKKSEEKEAEPDPSEMPGSHTLLNPATKHPFLESPLTASTMPEWQDPYDSVPIDPLSGDGPGKEQIFEHKTVIKPLSEQTAAKAEKTEDKPAAQAPATDVNAARNAVESALSSVPFDPANNPVESLGATELAEPAHEQPAAKPEPNGTPSLPIPGSTTPTPTDKADNKPTNSTAPPPVPPPFMPMSTPPFGNHAG
ncbi:MAG TPA: hypothetical protein VFT49_03045 [Candidatus Saccharimonadales bacterium]|nr:hypothetical protein [Candidatus Saccharimonadales bacterium]